MDYMLLACLLVLFVITFICYHYTNNRSKQKIIETVTI